MLSRRLLGAVALGAMLLVAPAAQAYTPFSIATVTENGSTNIVQVPFPYINQTDVLVYVGTSTTPLPAASYTWLTPSSIQLSAYTAGSLSGLAVRVQRSTQINGQAVTFQAGPLSYADLNTSDLQTLYSMQELWDQALTGLVVGPSGGSTTATSITVTQPYAGSTARTLQGKVNDQITLQDFLPVGQPDGATDNSAAFQAAATAGCAQPNPGIEIYVPPPPSGVSYVAHDIVNHCGNHWVGGGRATTPINYTGAAAFFMQWEPTGFPAVASTARISGGGIDGFTLNDSVGDGGSWALESFGTSGWRAENLTINQPFKGLWLYGASKPVTNDIQMVAARNEEYLDSGDIAGETSGSAACATSTTGDCSTKSDGWSGRDLVDLNATGTNIPLVIQGWVSGVTLDRVHSSGPLTGAVIACPAGLNSLMAQCPQGILLDDLSVTNFLNYGVNASDFYRVTLRHPHLVGTGGATVNGVIAQSVNYTNTTLPVGRLKITEGDISGVQNDCVYLGGTMWDVVIDFADISACNGAGGSWEGIDSQGTLAHLKVSHDTIGNVGNVVGAHAMARAVSLAANTTWAEVDNNVFDGVTSGVAPVLNASTSPATVRIHDNVGPGGVPTLGTCGTSPTIDANAHDTGFTLGINAATNGTCTVNFGTPFSAAPKCTATPGAGANPIVILTSTTTTSVTLTPNLGTALVAAAGGLGNYTIECKEQ